jgi:Flp pilus assembly pilin Flp
VAFYEFLNSAIGRGNRKAVTVFTNMLGTTMMTFKKTNGQNLIEYTIVVALISAAVAAMSTYVFRSVQSTQKTITQEFTND